MKLLMKGLILFVVLLLMIATFIACQPDLNLVEGDIHIAFDVNKADKPPQHVKGSIYIEGSSVTNISWLASLEKVDGDLIIRDTNITEIKMPYLSEIGGDFILVNNSRLQVDPVMELENPTLSEICVGDTAVSLPNLLHVRGDLIISYNADLHILAGVDENNEQVNQVECYGVSILDLSSIATVGGSLEISNNFLLTAILLTNLESVGKDLTIAENTLCSVFESPFTNMDAQLIVNNIDIIDGNVLDLDTNDCD